MNPVQKFLFETSFDGVESAAPAPDAPCQARPQSFNEQDLERMRDEGFATGREQGLKEAADSIDNASARALEAIVGQMQSLVPTLMQDAERRNGEALRAAVTIVRKLIPRAVETHGVTEIEGLVGQCLEHLRDEPRVVIRVCDELLDPLHERLDQMASDCGYEGKIVLLADDAFLPGDVRVEWADGGAERDSARLWREVDEIVARATTFGASAARSDPAQDTAARSAATAESAASPPVNGAEPPDPLAATSSEEETSAPAATGTEPEAIPAEPSEPRDDTTEMTQPA